MSFKLPPRKAPAAPAPKLKLPPPKSVAPVRQELVKAGPQPTARVVKPTAEVSFYETSSAGRIALDSLCAKRGLSWGLVSTYSKGGNNGTGQTGMRIIVGKLVSHELTTGGPGDYATHSPEAIDTLFSMVCEMIKNDHGVSW